MDERNFILIAYLIMCKLEGMDFDSDQGVDELVANLLLISEVERAAANLRATQWGLMVSEAETDPISALPEAEWEQEISNSYTDLISALEVAAQGNVSIKAAIKNLAEPYWTKGSIFDESKGGESYDSRGLAAEMLRSSLELPESSLGLSSYTDPLSALRLTEEISQEIDFSKIIFSGQNIQIQIVTARSTQLDFQQIDTRDAKYYYNFDAASAKDAKDSRDPSPICHIYAEMDERVILNRVTSLEVIISGDKLEWQDSATGKGGEVPVDPQKRLLIQAVAKTNFIIESDDWVEVDPPASGQTHQIYFDLRATHLGEGEVWVIVRQGQVSLLTLTIKPQIVQNRAMGRQNLESSPPPTMLSAPATLAAFSDSSCSPPSVSPVSNRIRAEADVIEAAPLAEPLHQLRIIEKRHGDQITYFYEIQSPALGILQKFESKPLTSDRHQYVEQIYKEIESRWRSNQDDVDSFTADLRAYGGQLFSELFPSELQSLLWQHRHQIQSIMVISTEPFIPWELVHLKPPGQSRLPDEMIFLGQMGLTRWLHDAGWPPEQIQIRSGQARYVIPHYPDTRYRLPQAEQENQFLETKFAATSVEPQLTPVRQLLADGNFDLLHFAGHGLAEQTNIANAQLMLQGRVENNRYIPAYFTATTVEQYSNFSRDNRPIVVLNACQIGREGYTLTSIGGFAQAFLKGGAGAFVGPLWSVGDKPARIFTESFYDALLEGQNLSTATIKARSAAQQSGDATWLAYAVYGHPHLKIRN